MEKLKRPRSAREKGKVKRKYCQGMSCRDHFYNGNNDLGVKECWHLKDTPIVWRDVYFSIHQRKPRRVLTMACFSPYR
jgi:hypothetical protein